jgi:DNA topoisomerase VI subunit B
MAVTAEKSISRKHFETSRELDFLSRKELIAQTGHQVREWPLVILKELVDNALDACEEAGVAPSIEIAVDDLGITISDNGPGIPPDVISSVLDFAVRVSSREAYVAPDRGRQGNALKTIVAMPFVLSGGQIGNVRIQSRGIQHNITLGVDRVRQSPVVQHEQTESDRKTGTSVFVEWRNSPGSIENQDPRFLQNDDDDNDNSPGSILKLAKERFLQIAQDYCWLNPHVSVSVDWLGEQSEVQAANTSWSKWKASNATDPHWYGLDELERLVAANVAHDADNGRNQLVREFLTEFRGLSGSAKVKQILDKCDMARTPLNELVRADGTDKTRLERLLLAMKEATKPVKPEMLGVIGKDHLEQRCIEVGGEPKSFQYKKVKGVNKGLPCVIETAFAWCPNATSRRIITGVNWSPGIINPFRQLGHWGQSLDSILHEQRAGREEPTVLMLHIACPKVLYADRGKSSIIVER